MASPSPDKCITLYGALVDSLIAALNPRTDEDGKPIPVPAATFKEIREFLKDNDLYTMGAQHGSKAEELVKKGELLLFKAGQYHG